MKKTKKILAAALSLACAGVIGAGVANWNVATAESTLPQNGDFFSVSHGTLTTTEAYQSNLGAGLKLSVTDANNDYTVLSYNDYIPAANMNESISFQVLPTTAGSADFRTVLLTFTDSVDETEVFTLTFISGEDTWYGNKGMANHVGFVAYDELNTFDGNGRITIKGTEQSLRGRDMLVGGKDYTTNGGTLKFTGTDGHTPYFAAEENKTSMLSVAYADGKVNINGKTIADLKNDTFQSESVESLDAEANADLIARYTDEYVDGLFSSGKVKMEMKIIEDRSNPNKKLDVANISVFKVGGVAATDGFTDTVAPELSMGASYNAETGKIEVVEGKNYEFSDFYIASASDLIDESPTLTTAFYRANGTPYTGTSASFSAGDYVVVTAVDRAGNRTEKRVDFHVISLGIQAEYFVELSETERAFAVLDSLPKGYSYAAELYDKEDGEYSSPLSQNGKYRFDDVGEYRLLLKVFDPQMSEQIFYATLTVTDATAPTMTFATEYEKEYSLNARVEIIVPELTDNNANGSVTYTVTTSFGHEAVAVENGTLFLSKAGRYTLVYTATDESGNQSTETLFVECSGKDTLAPQMSFASDYEKSYKQGQSVTVIAPSVSDNCDASPELSVEVVSGGKLIEIVDGKMKLNQSGTVYVLYTLTDANGNTVSEMKSFVCEASGEKSGGCNSSTTLGVLASALVLCAGGIAMKRRKEQ